MQQSDIYFEAMIEFTGQKVKDSISYTEEQSVALHFRCCLVSIVKIFNCGLCGWSKEKFSDKERFVWVM